VRPHVGAAQAPATVPDTTTTPTAPPRTVGPCNSSPLARSTLGRSEDGDIACFSGSRPGFPRSPWTAGVDFSSGGLRSETWDERSLSSHCSCLASFVRHHCPALLWSGGECRQFRSGPCTASRHLLDPFGSSASSPMVQRCLLVVMASTGTECRWGKDAK
jgi:hypothetical protein